MPWQQAAGCLPPSSTRHSLALPCVLQCNPFVRGTMEDGTTPVLRSGGGGTAGRDLQFYNNKAYLVTTQSVSPVAICTNTADVSPRARCCPRSGHSHGRAGIFQSCTATHLLSVIPGELSAAWDHICASHPQAVRH